VRTIKATIAVFGSKHESIANLTEKQPFVIIYEELFKNDRHFMFLFAMKTCTHYPSKDYSFARA
jgi:hypothetical protein